MYANGPPDLAAHAEESSEREERLHIGGVEPRGLDQQLLSAIEIAIEHRHESEPQRRIDISRRARVPPERPRDPTHRR